MPQLDFVSFFSQVYIFLIFFYGILLINWFFVLFGFWLRIYLLYFLMVWNLKVLFVYLNIKLYVNEWCFESLYVKC